MFNFIKKRLKLEGRFGKGRASMESSTGARAYAELLAAIEGSRNILGRYPLNVQIQTVSMCNATCYFCPYPESWQKQNPGTMSEEVYRKIIQEISHYKLGKFCPYFDEPLLDPKIFDRIEYALPMLDFRILEISTNASLLKQDKIDDIVRLFSPVNNEIWVSFHGIDKETHKAIMGLDFDMCKANILVLIEKSQDYNLNVVIRGSGMARVQSDVKPCWFTKEQYISFWQAEFKKHGFKKLPRIDYFTYHDRAGEIQRNEINFSTICRPSLENFYCWRIDQWAHFLYTGELILCCMDYHHRTVFGDITKNSLNEIYASENYVNLAMQVIGRAKSPDDFICKRCVSPGG
jgi:MoaA/NifB/PqqE/SkfB family radical SAM enzyme